MKNKHIFTIFFVLIFASCSKTENINQNEKKSGEKKEVEITFSVKPLMEQSYIGMNNNPSVSLKDQIENLRLTIVTKGGLRKEYIQKNSDQNFGLFNFKTQYGGHFTAIISADDFNDQPNMFLGNHPGPGFITGVRLSTEALQPLPLYVGTKEIYVDSQFPPKEEIILSRTFGKGLLIIQDTIPENISKITITTKSGIIFVPNTGYSILGNVVHEIFISENQKGKTETHHEFYIHPTKPTFSTDVTFDSFDVEGNLIYTRTIEDIYFDKSGLTRLAGKIFDNNHSGALFSISIDTAWIGNKYNYDF